MGIRRDRVLFAVGHEEYRWDDVVLAARLWGDWDPFEDSPCALGGGNSAVFAAAAGTSEFEEPSVGEFLLGSREAI